MPDTPILPTLTDEQITQEITDARGIVEGMNLVAVYSIAAFEVVLQRKMDDAYAQLIIDNKVALDKVTEVMTR